MQYWTDFIYPEMRYVDMLCIIYIPLKLALFISWNSVKKNFENTFFFPDLRNVKILLSMQYCVSVVDLDRMVFLNAHNPFYCRKFCSELQLVTHLTDKYCAVIKQKLSFRERRAVNKDAQRLSQYKVILWYLITKIYFGKQINNIISFCFLPWICYCSWLVNSPTKC